ncbi:MAG: ECF transporter S component [Butyricicoccus pullicaecorum]|nr:ECF transporter S component [Butyricicoccus pullicaecorum]
MDVRLMAQIALLAAIMIVMAFTPLGYIPLPFMNATTMHIPVIVGACLLGPKVGGVLGGLFGITSVVKATIQPNITSFVFTPFYSFSPEFSGNWMSLIVAILPRILIGVVAGLVFQGLVKLIRNQTVSLAVAGVLGSMTNTIGVMGLIYLLFGEQYAAAGGTDPSLLLGVILGVVCTNGIVEAIIAGVLTAAVCRALLAAFRKSFARV